MIKRPDPKAVLSRLKDFQRDTVDYVFQRMYLGEDPAHRFLIADEVGLGKTLVARGLIARAIDHLWDKIDRIDVVYICSNADIARQNINRLNVTGQADFSLASRITLLPIKIHSLKNNKLNFISFTPGTSFNISSNLGMADERALLYCLLKDAWSLAGAGSKNVFQGTKDRERFRNMILNFRTKTPIDKSLENAFVETLNIHVEKDHREGRASLRDRFDELADRFKHSRFERNVLREDRQMRRQFIGDLRVLLAETCLRSLEPDLIILDEFQRFKHLLDDDDPESQLARGLFNYSSEHSRARVVLLSATPYKMYTTADESDEEDHYRDFLRTMRFLEPDKERLATLENLLRQYRQELLRYTSDSANLLSAKEGLERSLRRVMVRTERLAVSEDRDGMLVQVSSEKARLEPRDLETYVALQSVARILNHGDTMEYWKSAPYLLNFMDDYILKNDFKAQIQTTDCPKIYDSLARTSNVLFPWVEFRRYAEVDPGNALLRSLISDTLELGAWKWLWIPPSLPYYELASHFEDARTAHFTKRLVFSSWRVVPKAVSTLLSYEAERRMTRSFEKGAKNTPEARKRRRGLLRFALTDGRLTGMPILGLLYPSVSLASKCDPLALLSDAGDAPERRNLSWVLAETSTKIKRMLSDSGLEGTETGVEDEAWYWAAPILLDLATNESGTKDWFERPELSEIWNRRGGHQVEEADESRWHDHVERARDLIRGKVELGKQPSDLPMVLANMALAGFGITVLRALSRISGDRLLLSSRELKDDAAQTGWAFLSLFNSPEVMSVIRGMNPDKPYWLAVVEYAAGGCLQAVLDEYAHVLRESLGLLDHDPEGMSRQVSDAIYGAVTLRTSTLAVDDVQLDDLQKSVVIEPGRMRARFALRYGEERGEEGADVTRKDQVRDAFNSPFWPLVLVTTSVGQEGLDFHQYCHAVVHWNLPSNPVDLEQREGRVHRYKGHAVRKNLALRFGHKGFKPSIDPWESLFDKGRETRLDGQSDLIPFWIFAIEGGAKIERHVPMFPLSRDIDRLASLRRSLTVYRMVFGQNRQEDLVHYLVDRLGEAEMIKMRQNLRVDLSPPSTIDTKRGSGG